MNHPWRILLLNGPNLNLLGWRNPQHYGTVSLADLVTRLQQQANDLGVILQHQQYNAEHQLVEAVQHVRDQVDFLLINAAAFTHTSIALRDVLEAVKLPFVEIHLSNIYAREAFRRHSYLAELAVGTISGLGADGYQYALQAAWSYLQRCSLTKGTPDGY